MSKSLLNKAEVRRVALVACNRRYENMDASWKKYYLPRRVGKAFYERIEYICLAAILAEVNNRPSKGLTL
jgi:hypothetical protein